jgi:hypothetical protein
LPAAYFTKSGTFFLSPEDPKYKAGVQRFLDIVLKENNISRDQHFKVPYQQTHLSAYRLTPAAASRDIRRLWRLRQLHSGMAARSAGAA